MSILHRIGQGVVWCVILVCLVPALAKSEASRTGDVRIKIANASDRRPIALARVVLVGPRSDFGYTAADGSLAFIDIPAGHYRITIYAPGFTQASSVFDVGATQTLDIAVALSKRGLATIATVTTRARLSAGTGKATANGILATTNGGLAATIGALPAIESNANGLSIGGLAVGGTALFADGSPLAGGGGSAALSPIGLDLFHSVTAEPIGGTAPPGIDLTTDDPTLAFSIAGSGDVESLGGSGGILTTTGTSGSLGYVAKFVSRTIDGPLDGAYYRDESGLSYSHTDQADGNGALLKLRAPFSPDDSVLGAISEIDLRSQAACMVASGGIPCGFGPGNATDQNFSDEQFRYAHAFPNANLNVTFSNSTQLTDVDDRQRIVNGQRSPYQASSSTGFASTSLHFDQQIERNTLSLDATAQRQTISGGTAEAATPELSTRFDVASIGDTLALRTGSSLRLALNLPLTGTKLGASAEFDDALANGSTFSAAVRAGQPEQPPLPPVTLSGNAFDPPSLSYDCLHQHVFVNGTTTDVNSPSDTGATLGYKRENATWALEAQASHDSIANSFVPAVGPGMQYGPNAITPSILNAISAFYASPGACGISAPLTPSSIIVDAPISAHLLYDRVTLSLAHALFGAIVAPYVQLQSARYDAANGPAEVPFVPQYRAGLIVDDRIKPARTEVLAFLDYEGSNNPLGLPSYLVTSAGASRELDRGVLSVGINNLANVRAFRFASSAYAAPLPNGIVPIAMPLQPRTFYVSYRVTAGTQAVPSKIDALAALASVAQPSQDVFSIAFSAWSGIPPEHPFEPDTTQDTCTPESLPTARAVLAAVKAGPVMDTSRTPGGALPVPVDPAFGITITAHRINNHFAFVLSSNDQRSERRFSGCVRETYATVDQLRAHGAYVPTEEEADKAFVFFDPLVGWYRPLGASPSSQVQTESRSVPTGPSVANVTLDPPPSSPPVRPLRLRRSCPRAFAAFAGTVLGEMRHDVPAVLSGRREVRSPYYRAFRVSNGRAVWVRIAFLDALSLTTIESCAHVAGVSPADLSKAGLSGNHSGLEFAPVFGLFESI